MKKGSSTVYVVRNVLYFFVNLVYVFYILISWNKKGIKKSHKTFTYDVFVDMDGVVLNVVLQG